MRTAVASQRHVDDAQQFLDDGRGVAAAARQPVYLLVTDDADGALTPAERDARFEDWRALADRAGIPADRVASNAEPGA